VNRLIQREPSGGLRPLRLRVAALLCVVLVAVAGVAQAAHIHGKWLPNSAAQVSAHTTLSDGVAEDACPLCVAMHSALPVSGYAAVLVALLLETGTFSVLSREPRSTWYFAAFSRPPPELKL
jgi:hypothetical protein